MTFAWGRRRGLSADGLSRPLAPRLRSATDRVQRGAADVVAMMKSPLHLSAFMGHRSIANTVVYTAVADKRAATSGQIG
jgi:hypothetical protein